MTDFGAIHGVIFDLDGTLLDTLEDIAVAFNGVLARHGLPLHPLADYRHLVGDGAWVLAQRALPPDWRTEERIAACSREYVAAYRNLAPVRALPYPGIAQLLDGLVARGIPAAVLSNKSHDNAVSSVASLLASWPLSPVLGLREGVPRKPDPSAALEIARKLDLPPERIVFVGDTPNDIQTARAAGMLPAGACWGFRDEAELRAAGASLLLRHPADLLGRIDGKRAGK